MRFFSQSSTVVRTSFNNKKQSSYKFSKIVEYLSIFKNGQCIVKMISTIFTESEWINVPMNTDYTYKYISEIRRSLNENNPEPTPHPTAVLIRKPSKNHSAWNQRFLKEKKFPLIKLANFPFHAIASFLQNRLHIYYPNYFTSSLGLSHENISS